jgi:hypothetical protein
VLFMGKVGERIRIVDVLFIPCLKNIIASLGQLDENGCKVAIETGSCASGIASAVSSSRSSATRASYMCCRSMS